MIEITEQMKTCIESAPAEGVHCLVATADPDGWPQIAPKGSVIVHDAQTLAYWDRVLGTTLDNLARNPRMTVYYRNPARRDELPGGAGWRFFGTAEVLREGPVRDQVMARTPRAELDRDPERKGAAVLIHIERITDVSGRTVQERG